MTEQSKNELKELRLQEMREEQERFKDEETDEGVYYRRILLWTVGMYIPSLLHMFLGPIAVVGEESLYWWHIVLFVQIVVSFKSVFNQNQDEVGGVFLFKRFLFQTNPGLVVAPWPVCQYRRDRAVLKQWEIPGDLPDRYNGEQTVRITTAPSKVGESEKSSDGVGSEGQDPLNTGRLTLEGKFIIAARLDKTRGAYRQFIERIGSLDNFLQIADDLTVNRISKEVIKKSPSEVYEDWQEIEDKALENLEDTIGFYGFAELDVKAKGFDLPKRVNQGLADRTKQHIAVGTGRLAGEESKLRDTGVAAGKRALAAAPVLGAVDGLIHARSQLKLDQQQALFLSYQETLAKTLEKANYSLLPQGKGGMMDPASMMAVMQEAIIANEGRDSGLKKQDSTDQKQEIEKEGDES